MYHLSYPQNRMNLFATLVKKFVRSSWNFVKMIIIWGGHFGKVSWRSDKLFLLMLQISSFCFGDMINGVYFSWYSRFYAPFSRITCKIFFESSNHTHSPCVGLIFRILIFLYFPLYRKEPKKPSFFQPMKQISNFKVSLADIKTI